MRPVDVEMALVSFLTPKVACPVSTRVPNPRPTKFVTVDRIGGVRQNLGQERALILVFCWGANDVEAFHLAQTVWGALDRSGEFLSPGVWLADNGLASPISNSDPDTGADRYQFTANMVVNLEETP